MSGLPKTLEKVIDSFSRLPGIGKKSAQRLGMHIMKMDNEFVSDFANALLEISWRWQLTISLSGDRSIHHQSCALAAVS